jgi:hypothetical protein
MMTEVIKAKIDWTRAGHVAPAGPPGAAKQIRIGAENARTECQYQADRFQRDYNPSKSFFWDNLWPAFSVLEDKMRHEAIQNSAAVVLVAFALGLYISGSGTGQTPVDRGRVQERLQHDVADALQNSSLSASEKQSFLTARNEFRQLIKAQREGQTVDKERLGVVSGIVKSVITGPAIRPEDRARIQQTLQIVDAMWREERARARREALVAQLGYPMGLLADMVVAD